MKKTFAVRLPDEQRADLNKIAEREDRSVSATIRRAINEYIKKFKINEARNK